MAVRNRDVIAIYKNRFIFAQYAVFIYGNRLFQKVGIYRPIPWKSELERQCLPRPHLTLRSRVRSMNEIR